MKKLLFFFALLFMGAMTAFAQAPTHEQLTYQTVVRNAQNQLVFNQNDVTVKVYVCNVDGTVVTYSETHTGLSTNANGMLSLMIGSVAPDQGTWDGIDWSTAYIKTTISYGSVTITSDPAPVTAVPYALSAGNMSNITNIIGDAIHDSLNRRLNSVYDSLARLANELEELRNSILPAASRTVKPCTVSGGAHQGSEYIGTGFEGAKNGYETANGEGKITSVTDFDGNAYPVVQIGNQCWMAENLRCSHSPKTGSNLVVTAVKSYGSKMAAWYQNNQSAYEAKRYGLLYNWCAAMDTANPGSGNGGSGIYVEVVASDNNNDNSFNFSPSGNHQGVCPKGWHVPTDAEWNVMEKTVSDTLWQPSYESMAGTYRGSHAGKLSTGCDWSSSGTENAAGNYANAERNDSGFSAVPAGYFAVSFFLCSGDYAYFWSSSQNSSSDAWDRGLNYDNAGVYRNEYGFKNYGFSVRCVRD